MEVEVLEGSFTVCQVADYSLTDLNAAYCFTGKTGGERSLVCLTADVPPNTTHREDGWRAFRVAGPLAFSLTGILAGIAKTLAEAKVPIFALSTFDTDYVLVKAADFEKALVALRAAAYTVR